MGLIRLKDNCYDGKSVPQESIIDVQAIASIGNLGSHEDLLVFPHSFTELHDGIDKLSIITLKDAQFAADGKCTSVKACTGNLMGFVGHNDTSLSISSRFTASGNDNFLYYMLHKVLAINVFALEHTASCNDHVIDFMLFLFPRLLKQALRQGLYKEYQRNHYDDDRVRGAISVGRFIHNDVPFRGRVSYSMREYSYDNPVTQLVRHTIEYIRRHPFGSPILNNDAETKGFIDQIVTATPSFNPHNRWRVINANRHPCSHPYYTLYRALQQLCLQILQHETLKYGHQQDKVYGVLFDGAWLWEEYLNTVLQPHGFVHPENKIGRGSLPMFTNGGGKLFPDFYREEEDANYIFDAKYKHLENGVGSEDLYQVVTYMHCTKATHGGYAYPCEKDLKPTHHELCGYGGQIHVVPVFIPPETKFSEFVKRMRKVEEKVISCIASESHICLNG